MVAALLVGRARLAKEPAMSNEPPSDSYDESEEDRAARLDREAAYAATRVHLTPGQIRMLARLQHRP